VKHSDFIRMPGSTYSQDTIQNEKLAAQRTSQTLMNACITGFIGGLLLLISFASPYWLQSWGDTNSPFTNMGLWEVCFFRFRFPKFQFDRLFTGCHAVWGTDYRLIREWLLPWWLMLVQFFMAFSFLISFIGQMFDVCLLLRWPLERILRLEWQIVYVSFILKGLTAVTLFVTVCLFGGSCWDRGWLLYPNYNYVSWSYAFACFSMVAHGGAAFLMFVEGKAAKERKERNMALVMQMYPTPGLFDGSLNTYHGSQFI